MRDFLWFQYFTLSKDPDQGNCTKCQAHGLDLNRQCAWRKADLPSTLKPIPFGKSPEGPLLLLHCPISTLSPDHSFLFGIYTRWRMKLRYIRDYVESSNWLTEGIIFIKSVLDECRAFELREHERELERSQRRQIGKK